jgi:hypothetical protein
MTLLGESTLGCNRLPPSLNKELPVFENSNAASIFFSNINTLPAIPTQQTQAPALDPRWPWILYVSP